jgi:hypothetical protein
MCDEDKIASKLKRINGEDLTTNLKRDIEAFFAEKYATSSCNFQLLAPQEEHKAKVDFTVSRGSDFSRRYVGSAGYVDDHLSLAEVIRLF